jgi:hypothetical protein
MSSLKIAELSEDRRGFLDEAQPGHTEEAGQIAGFA